MKTVLTNEQIDQIAISSHIMHESRDHDIQFARSIEQAVLQSSEVQALRKDAERYRFIRDGDQEVWCSSGDDLLTNENLDSTIDAAMEKQKLTIALNSCSSP